MAEIKPAEKPMTQLTPSKIDFAEHSRNQWFVVPEHGTPFDALSDPKFWAHVAARFKICDEIIVHAEDGSYYGRLIVRDCGRLYAKTAPLEYVEFDKVDVEAADALPPGYEVKWRGPIKKWCVVRGADPLKEGQTKEGAMQWLREHLRAVGT